MRRYKKINRQTIAWMAVLASIMLNGPVCIADDFDDFDSDNLDEFPADDLDSFDIETSRLDKKNDLHSLKTGKPEGKTISGNNPWDKLNEKGLKALKRKNYTEAEQWFKQALKTAEEQAEKNPGQTNLPEDISVPGIKSDPLMMNNVGIVDSLLNLSLLRHEQGDHVECERLHELAMRYMEAITQSRNDPRFADRLPGIAAIYYDHGKIRQAEVLYKDLIRIREQSYGKDDPRLASAFRLYSKFLRKQGRASEAVLFEQKAKTIETKRYQ